MYWIDVFTREDYFTLLTDSLDYCRKNKGMEIYAWCIIPSHMHLIFRAKDNNISVLLKELKTYTSIQLQKAIAEYNQESRKEWILWLMERAGFISAAEHWKYSCAIDFSGEKGVLEIDIACWHELQAGTNEGSTTHP